MVILIGLVAAVLLGTGWVLQQQVAEHASNVDALSWRLTWYLMHKPVWWTGIAVMAAGASFGGWALQRGTVAFVEPLLSVNLLVAFVVVATMHGARPRPREVFGALLVSAALACYLVVGNPHAGKALPSNGSAIPATIVVASVTVALVLVARRSSLRVESVLLATAAGILYGLQDAVTRAAFTTDQRHGLIHLLYTPWPYLLLVSATAGVLLSQNAFRAARLDYSLPPTAAAEPITGAALGVSILGDRMALGSGHVAGVLVCVAAMIFGVVLIGRAESMSSGGRRRRVHH